MREKILEMLRESPGEISGEKISQELHISRAAVSKHIKVLRKEGYIIDALTKRGYTFREPTTALVAQEIYHYLNEPELFEIHCMDTVDSTNLYLRKLAMAGSPHFTAVTAEEQSGGRGRLDRKWYSPPGAGIWLSLLFRPTLAPQNIQWLTLLIAVSIAEALERYGFDCRIKWPNDILLNKKKVCGILLEMQSDMDHVHWVVAGMGININNQAFPEELKDKATSLYQEKALVLNRAEITASILQTIKDNYQSLISEGFSPLREKWLSKAIGLGEKARVVSSQGVIEGTAMDMDEKGYLLIQSIDGNIQRITGGDFLPSQIDIPERKQ